MLINIASLDQSIMLISHPSVMFMNIRWIQAAHSLCCLLASLFPKVFCSVTLTWSLYCLLLEVCYNQLYLGFNHPGRAMVVGIVGVVLYVLCVYSYFMVIIAGGGSPMDFDQLRIRNIDLLINKNQNDSANRKKNDINKINIDNDVHNDNDDAAADTKSAGKARKGVGSGDNQALCSGVVGSVDESGTNLLQEEPDKPPTEYVNFHITRPGVSPYRYCIKCKVWKPDRCHHCSTCNKCILRMDHHCPWFASCIGYYNQKFFIQNLIYITLYSGFVFIITLILLLDFFRAQNYHNSYLSLKLVFLFIIALTFFVTIGVFSLFLIWLLMKNVTTIEFQERNNFNQYEFAGNNNKKKTTNIFDLGSVNNWKSTMGHHWIYWVLPMSFTKRAISSSVNGLNFPINHEVYDDWCANVKLQEQLNQQLTQYRDSVRQERMA